MFTNASFASRSPSRRSFLKAGGAMAAAAASGVGLGVRTLQAEVPTASTTLPASGAVAIPRSETLVASLFKTLSAEQRQSIAFPFDHPLRSKVDNNWMITNKSLAQLLTPDQRDMVRQIFIGMHSPEYADRVLKQVEHDNQGDGGFNACAIALFGEPASDADAAKSKFEFVFTGRHVTRRCDGNSVEGAAFGGPIFYGHAAEGFREKADHPGNIYWYQAQRANELFQALDGKQRQVALRDDPRDEDGSQTVALPGRAKTLKGLAVGELSHDQKDLMQKVMADVLAPFRKEDADEAMQLMQTGGLDQLHLSYFKNLDIGNDGVWDLWQIEGPGVVWYFRGAPHVHAWVHVRDAGATAKV